MGKADGRYLSQRRFHPAAGSLWLIDNSLNSFKHGGDETMTKSANARRAPPIASAQQSLGSCSAFSLHLIISFFMASAGLR